MTKGCVRLPGLRDQLSAAARQLEVVAERPRFEAEMLWGHVLGLSRAGLIAADDDVLTPERIAFAENLVERRSRGEPMAYLVGRRGFWTLDLSVTPDTLVPRPETEGLVEWALESIPASGVWNIADLGTGTGAIALAVASERPKSRVVATDASLHAMAVACGNAKRLALSNVEFRAGDWCEALDRTVAFDLILSNPPYIAEGDPHLADLSFEPLTALVSGVDGLDAIRTIVCQARDHLRAGGLLRLEHGADQAESVRNLLKRAGYIDVETRPDLSGHERMTGARKP